jgi:hypothetical protein
MPLKRTPPLTPTNLSAGAFQSLAHSDPNISVSVDAEDAMSNVTQRSLNTKRKREELVEKCDLDDFKSLMMNMFQDLKNTMKEIKEQNTQLQESVNFTAAKYEEIKEKMQKVEEERTEDRKYICQLEEKLEQLERQGRASSLEIRNIPITKDETKLGLTKIVADLGKTINVPIQESDVKDIFRVNAKTSKPLIIDFTTVLLKENILRGIKKFNKDNRDNKLNTGYLKMDGPNVPIFISENLTSKTKRLFFLAREFGAQNKFKYCWTSYGKVFLRKEDGTPLIRIESEKDLNKISNTL